MKYQAKLRQPQSSVQANVILNERNRISELVSNQQPTRFHDSQQSQWNSNQMTYESTAPNQVTPADKPGYSGSLTSGVLQQKLKTTSLPMNPNSAGLGSSGPIIGVGSQIIQSSTNSKLGSSRKGINTSILSGRALSAEEELQHQFQQMNLNGATERLVNGQPLTGQAPVDQRDIRLSASRGSNYQDHQAQGQANARGRPEDVHSPNSQTNGMGQPYYDKHMAVMKDLMPHYSEVTIKQKNQEREVKNGGSMEVAHGRQRFAMPERVSVTPTKIPSHKNNPDQLYQPSAHIASSAINPSRVERGSLIQSPVDQRARKVLENQAEPTSFPAFNNANASSSKNSKTGPGQVSQGANSHGNDFSRAATTVNRVNKPDSQDLNQPGMSRAGGGGVHATLNSVRSVRFPNTINQDKSQLLHAGDNMTTAYQHFLSTQGRQQAEATTPRGRNIGPRTTDGQQVDSVSKQPNLPQQQQSYEDPGGKSNKQFQMKPYDIAYDMKTGVFNTQHTNTDKYMDDHNESSKEMLSNTLQKSQYANTSVSHKLKKSKGKNTDDPYKLYNTATEQDPEQHQQDFVIRKLKQNADSRTKLRLGDQERDDQETNQTNRSQLKRKRDSDISPSQQMLRNNSQNEQNYTSKTKRQKISKSKSKSRAKIQKSRERSNQSENSDQLLWSQKSVLSFVTSKSLDVSDASSQDNSSSGSDTRTVSKATARQKDRSSSKKKEENALSTLLLDKWNKEKQIIDNVPSENDAFSRYKVQIFIDLNPINPVFIRREKARLPYSVFKPHSQEVSFLKSIFEGRPPTAFFPYPPYVHLERVSDRIRIYNREEIEYLFMSFKISDSTHIYNAVVNSCKNAGFTMVEGANPYFNVQWTGYITANDIKHLNKYQKTNHFPMSAQLGRKDLLWKNMNRLRTKHPGDFAIAPMSYLLSDDFEAFQKEREREPDCLWILKPVAASCGRGIKIIDKNTAIRKKEGILASKYIANPHLINGLKYDLRVYVLVTSFNPLKVYIYNDGLVRFATEKYTNDPSRLSKKYVHLTNFSVNKKNANFIKNQDKLAKGDDDDGDDGENSSKWDFKMLKEAYVKQGINYQYIHAQFKDIIVKTLMSVEPHITQHVQKNPTTRNNCFEIYGFDIMVDDKQKPWILEVNVLPSLSSSSPFDKRIKTMLMCDALTLIGIRGYDKSKFHAQSTELLGLPPFAQSMQYVELKAKENGQLDGTEELTKDEIEMLMDLDEEFMRRGNFQRVYPLASNVQFYEQFFEFKRYQNALVSAYLQTPQEIRDKLLHKHKRVFYTEV